jgi:hypothetical protein
MPSVRLAALAALTVSVLTIAPAAAQSAAQ